jgi:hypothetical protein
VYILAAVKDDNGRRIGIGHYDFSEPCEYFYQSVTFIIVMEQLQRTQLLPVTTEKAAESIQFRQNNSIAMRSMNAAISASVIQRWSNHSRAAKSPKKMFLVNKSNK